MDQKPPSPSTSPNSSTSSNTSSTNHHHSNNNNGASASLPPLTPKSIPNLNPNPNPYPTTFIQADPQSFKQVVQMLTGSAETTAKRAAVPFTPPPPSSKNPIPPISKANKKPPCKLYERRNSMKNLKMISPLIPNSTAFHASSAFSPRSNQLEILSPSVLDFPSLALSPVTPLIPDPFNRSPPMSAEDRAIAERGFYLHPSPRSTPREAEPPKLLPLFPLTSPRMESSS